MQKIYKLSDMDVALHGFQRQNKIVLCHGVFDILHAGHLAYFAAAKEHGAILVVTLTSDRYVNKGPARPVFSQDVRARMLAALEIVDFVAISDYPTAIQAIEKIKPDFYVKGPDYRDRTKDVTGEIVNEEAAIEKVGGQIVFTSDETFSSSTLANKFFVNWTEEQQQYIERVKGLGGMSAIEAALKKLEALAVTVIGEPILDVYRFCEPQGISSKSPSISAKYLYEESYRGGAWAIQNHLRDFVKSVNLLEAPGFKVPRKIRYIAVDKSQRMFEVTDIDEKFVPALSFAGQVKSVSGDLVLVADFGHGLIEGPVLKSMLEIKPFVALNAQTNSSNLPFNPYHKHKRFDYLSIDTREMRIARHDKNSSPEYMAKTFVGGNPTRTLSLTLGSNGAWFEGIKCPAFADAVVDATGAGDAYFAITSALVKTNCEPHLIPFIGNVFAGLKTKIIGNKSAVTRAQLVKALQGILK